MMKERVLITGVTGFIGKFLAHELYKSGYSVAGLTRNIQRSRTIFKFPILLYEWKDIQKPPPFSAFENTTIVINLAGESIIRKKWNSKQKQILWDSRVLLTHHLVQTLNLFPHIHTLIQTSAIGYYGKTEEKSIDENSRTRFGFYGSSLSSLGERGSRNS